MAPGRMFQLAEQQPFIWTKPDLHLADVPQPGFHPRRILPRLSEALADTHVVLIHGPRQSGKTTLARTVGDKAGYAYISFDDDVLRAAAQADPVGFVADLPDKAVLDEVQRVPELFTSIKAVVDRDRRPGRFILTGSANVPLVPKLADSLAGRMEILRLHPLAQAELAGKPPGFLAALFGDGFKGRPRQRLGRELAERIAAGGYPAALARPAARRRAAWYRDYIDTLVQRDVRDLARISTLDALPRLMTLAAGRTARLINVAEFGRPLSFEPPHHPGLCHPAGARLSAGRAPLLTQQPAQPIIKTPKLHAGDTGLACALLGADAAMLASDRPLLGQLLESFVFRELRCQASWEEEPIAFHHFRDKDGVEVDIVLERGGRHLAGVEVKAAATVTAADFKSLRKLQEAAGQRFVSGVVLYDGEVTASFGDGLFAVPIRALWETK